MTVNYFIVGRDLETSGYVCKENLLNIILKNTIGKTIGKEYLYLLSSGAKIIQNFKIEYYPNGGALFTYEEKIEPDFK